MHNSNWATSTAGAEAFPWTMPKPFAGIGWPPGKARPQRSSTLGSGTPLGEVSSRIPYVRTCGSTSNCVA